MSNIYRTEQIQAEKIKQFVQKEYKTDDISALLILVKTVSYILLNTEYNVLQEVFCGKNQSNRLLLRKLYTILNSFKAFEMFKMP